MRNTAAALGTLLTLNVACSAGEPDSVSLPLDSMRDPGDAVSFDGTAADAHALAQSRRKAPDATSHSIETDINVQTQTEPFADASGEVVMGGPPLVDVGGASDDLLDATPADTGVLAQKPDITPPPPPPAEKPPVLPAPGSGWQSAPQAPPYWTDGSTLPTFESEKPPAPVALVTPKRTPWTEGHAIAVRGDEIFVAATDHAAMVVLDRLTGLVLRTVPVGARPVRLVVAPDGTVFVAVRGQNQVVRIAPNGEMVTNAAQAGHEPTGLALSEDLSTLFVVSFVDGQLHVFDAMSLTLIWTYATAPYPRAVGVTPSKAVEVIHERTKPWRFEKTLTGTYAPTSTGPLRVANPAEALLNPGVASASVASRAMSVANAPVAAGFGASGATFVAHVIAKPGTEELAEAILLGSASTKSTSVKETCTSTYYGAQNCTQTVSSKETVTAPALIRPIEATVTRLGKAVVPALPVSDPATGEPMTALVDSPSDLAHHPTHSLLCVVGMGTDNVLVLGSNSADPMRAPLGQLKVGRAPSAIAFSDDGLTAYVLDTLDHAVSRIDLAPFVANGGANTASATIPFDIARSHVAVFAEDPTPKAQRAGRRTFFFARAPGLSAGGRFSCNSCHVEGGEDGQVWFGADGPRQTPLLAGRLKDTAPFNWLGTKAVLKENIEQTITRLGGIGVDAETLASLTAFVTEGLPVDAKLPTADAEAVAKGEALFHSAELGCSGCHAPPALTDGGLHVVGTTTALEKLILAKANPDMEPSSLLMALNTPTLRGLSRSAPYFHDGSAANLEAVFAKTALMMGTTLSLTSQQRADLISYLKTL